MSPVWSMALAPAIVPTANTPTAIESTTSTDRIGWLPRSRRALRQRTLRTGRPARGRFSRVAAAVSAGSSIVPSRIRPSAMWTVRRVRFASSASWVTVTIVRPWSTSDSNSANTMSAVAESRLPVGSSATISGGSLASARATATRCCCPPEVLDGSLRAWSAMPDALEQVHRPVEALARRPQPAEVHRQHHVLDHRQRRQQLEELEDHADRAPAPLGGLALGQAGEVLAGDRDRAAGRAVDAGDHVHQRRLAAARPADDRDELAPVHLEVDAVERPERPRVGDVVLDHAAQVDQVLAARGRTVLADAPVRAVARSAKHVGSRMPNPVGEQVRRAAPAAAESIPARSNWPPVDRDRLPRPGRQAVANLVRAGGDGGVSRCSRTRRRSCALAATMMVERLMAMAPTAIERSMPHGTKMPIATGIATRL